MTIPFAMMPAGCAETLSEIRYALEQRVTNATNRLTVAPSFHRGQPNDESLPDEELGIWLDWSDIGPDPDEPERAIMLQSTWILHIICKDTDTDAFGGGVPLCEQVWGEILHTLTQTTTDVGLDGAIDFIPTPNASHDRGVVAGSNMRVNFIRMEIVARHSEEDIIAIG